ncbi:leucine-rich repeat-containing protein 37A-like [Monodon monoceros]|uniref:leucine-rich repeat-containing protein 37A-like n=1 Tax=Monodon monoceros TaxID=40151 RepID=UPI0010F810B0|nr:leucine-rich repeat-containing protein 37A-like [Monodon monoceros]
MSRLRLWLPRLFLTWLQLWLQFQAIQPPAWALGPIQVTKEVEPSPVQQHTPSQPPDYAEEVEPSPTQQETTGQPPEPLVEAEPSPSEKEQPTQREVEPSPTQQEQPAQTPEHHETTVSPPSHPHAQHSNLSSVAVKPADVELTITKEPTPEVVPSPPQQEATAQPPEPPVHQGAPIQPPYPEVTFPNPEQVQAHHPTLIEVTIQPLDLGLTRRPEPTKEDEPSPVMQETLTQPAEPPKEVFVAQPPVFTG